ncbi:hypothetical protein [Legionella hackeliae]|uniref:Uncharacterized protein n=1 Tax=Legionella hackeliae TaxID=449 RepID=A0A0A8UQB3_LEGHA|nr:hypothetical protein [Legionella hackeliae]KTD13436.1 hypothetical protein Lhac_0820 [Legionella hackeliae]CEK09277.1 protein of unknown function [Legionella hackeliae]STX49184.1 Uncharacterised protein [Legionella hackeliae]
MKKSSQAKSKKQTKEKVNKNKLKDISGGFGQFGDHDDPYVPQYPPGFDPIDIDPRVPRKK